MAALTELEQTNVDEHVRYLLEFVRRMQQGKFGRFLETLRCDKPEDIGDFYKEKDQTH